MDKDYLDILRKTDMRPGKVKVKESREEILLELDRGESDIHAEIIKLFLANPYPKEEMIQKWAKDMGMTEPVFEEHIYMILSSFLSEGYSKGKDVKHDPKELEMGIKVEYEHTTDPLMSRKIAMDHLHEIADYYTRLAEMEANAKKEKK